jgi:hypothetical protein
MTTRALQITELLTPVIDHRTNSVASAYTAYFYSAGTSSAKNVWTEKEKTNPYTSRTLGSDGTAQVYGDGVYRIIIKDTDSTTVHDWDNIKVQANTFTVQTKSGTYTATADDDLILCSGTFTVNLATVAGFTHPLIIKRVSGTITVDPYSSETVDGSSTITLTSADDSAVLYPDVASSIWRRADSLSGLTATVDEINNKCDDDDGNPLWTSSTSQKPAMGLKNTNADASGAIFKGIKDSASPADDDELLSIEGHGDDGGGTETTFAKIQLISSDVTDTDEAGEITVSVLMDGTSRSLLNLNGYNGSVNQGEVVINEDGQDVDFRVEAATTPTALQVLGSDGSITINGAGISGSVVKDEDNMASDSATSLVTQQSVVAFVETTLGYKSTIERSIFAYNGGATAYTVLVGGGAYRVADKIAFWNSQLTTSAIPTPAAATRYYLYLDYSAITSGTAITNSEMIWSSTAPTYNHQYKGWYNGSDLCIFSAITDGTPNNIINFHHDGGRYVEWDTRIGPSSNQIQGITTFQDLSLAEGVPAFSTIAEVTFETIPYAGGGTPSYVMVRQNGSSGSGKRFGSGYDGGSPSYDTARGKVYLDASQIMEWRHSAANGDTQAYTDGFYLPGGM